MKEISRLVKEANEEYKQRICGRKRKEHGRKYFLNIERLDKIKEIIKEKGNESIILILLIL